VGVSLGAGAGRREIARRLAADLIQWADKLMYEAKSDRASHIYLRCSQIVDGALVEVASEGPASLEEPQR
jgi:hypothetical protein